MSPLIDFDLRDGGSILVEVDEVGGALTRGGRAADVVTRAGETLEDVLARVGPAVRGIVTQLRDSTQSPGEVEIEFAIKLSAESGVIIAKTGGEANFRVALRWTHPAKQ